MDVQGKFLPTEKVKHPTGFTPRVKRACDQTGMFTLKSNTSGRL
jgi:hypothetical protein